MHEPLPTVSQAPILEARNLSVHYRVGSRSLSALIDASLSVSAGETVALVGESGSGKSTLAMAMMRVRRQKTGVLLYRGQSILDVPDAALKEFRRDVQMIFQDPYSSLDPRMTVAGIIGEGLRAHGIGNSRERRDRVAELLEIVGLPEDSLTRGPAQFSGGQRQRVAIARALSLDPSLIIADEPVSALDVSIQAQIVNLLRSMQVERNISFLLVSHDLPLVHHLATRVVVLYLGRVVETGCASDLVRHPNTRIQQLCFRQLLRFVRKRVESASYLQGVRHRQLHAHLVVSSIRDAPSRVTFVVLRSPDFKTPGGIGPSPASSPTNCPASTPQPCRSSPREA